MVESSAIHAPTSKSVRHLHPKRVALLADALSHPNMSPRTWRYWSVSDTQLPVSAIEDSACLPQSRLRCRGFRLSSAPWRRQVMHLQTFLAYFYQATSYIPQVIPMRLRQKYITHQRSPNRGHEELRCARPPARGTISPNSSRG